jgi:hypothetical protein
MLIEGILAPVPQELLHLAPRNICGGFRNPMQITEAVYCQLFPGLIPNYGICTVIRAF